jgi:agmatinase
VSDEAPPRNFLGLPNEYTDPEQAAVRILPVPYEATVSYLGGTKHGPQAIIDASRAVELYDIELDDEPFDIGVATLPEVALTGAGPAQAMRQLRRAYTKAAAPGRFVIMLGGEHSISSPPILEHAARLKKQRRKLSVLQLDAHGDLREEWEGTPWSHASVMRRVADDVDLVQVGIRAISVEERALMRKRVNTITTVFAEEMEGAEDWQERAIRALGKDVYISIDVDYFDPALVPSTGTPEPGGGQWYPALRLLRRVFAERNVVAADVVELAPMPGNAAPDFLVARLVYKLIAYHKHARSGRGR